MKAHFSGYYYLPGLDRCIVQLENEPEPSNLVILDDHRPGPQLLFSALAMCLGCTHRWVAGIPPETSLFMLECPNCHVQNSFASVLPREYLGEFGVE